MCSVNCCILSVCTISVIELPRKYLWNEVAKEILFQILIASVAPLSHLHRLTTFTGKQILVPEDRSHVAKPPFVLSKGNIKYFNYNFMSLMIITDLNIRTISSLFFL